MKRRTGIRRRLGRIILRLFVTGLLLTVIPVLCLRWIAPPTSSFMLQRRLEAWRTDTRDLRIQYRWADWEAISSHAKLAVVAAEDQKFPHHRGFDFESIGEAWQERLDGRRIRGASTITQQVAKNLFLWPGRSFIRKGLEAYFAVLIELLWSKQRILEIYLNIAEFGDGIYGVRAASDIYYHKAPAGLGRWESARLAAVLPNPARYRIDRPSAYVKLRTVWILEQMRRLGGRHYLKDL